MQRTSDGYRAAVNTGDSTHFSNLNSVCLRGWERGDGQCLSIYHKAVCFSSKIAIMERYKEKEKSRLAYKDREGN